MAVELFVLALTRDGVVTVFFLVGCGIAAVSSLHRESPSASYVSWRWPSRRHPVLSRASRSTRCHPMIPLASASSNDTMDASVSRRSTL